MFISGSHSAHVHREGGTALLVMLLVVMLAVGSVLLQQLSNNSSLTQQRSERTAQALAEAKAALLAHAVTFGEMHPVNASPTGSTTEDDVTLPPGTLPCPERSLAVGGEGAESATCEATDVASVGRFPWRALGIGPVRDGDNECLWYLVSGSFKANPGPHVLNGDSVGQFRILDSAGNVLVGTTPESRAAALIIASGPPLAGQDRSSVAGTDACGGNYTPGNYLDAPTINGVAYNNANPSASANAVIDVVTGQRAGLNDRIIVVSPAEVFAAIEQRRDFSKALYDQTNDNGTQNSPALAQKIAAMLANYGKSHVDLMNLPDPNDHRLPWAAPLHLSSLNTTPVSNDFDDVATTYAGRPPYRIEISAKWMSPIVKSSLVPSTCEGIHCRLLVIGNATGIDWWRVGGKPLYSPDSAPAIRGTDKIDSPDGWWDRWKDQFFYAVSPEFSPSSPITWTVGVDPCALPGNTCISVNGHRFAAVVIHAGSRLTDQSRATLADKINIANYLEPPNDAAFSAPTTAVPRNFISNASDRMVCIVSADLTLDSTCTNGPT